MYLRHLKPNICREELVTISSTPPPQASSSPYTLSSSVYLQPLETSVLFSLALLAWLLQTSNLPSLLGHFALAPLPYPWPTSIDVTSLLLFLFLAHPRVARVVLAPGSKSHPVALFEIPWWLSLTFLKKCIFVEVILNELPLFLPCPVSHQVLHMIPRL